MARSKEDAPITEYLASSGDSSLGALAQAYRAAQEKAAKNGRMSPPPPDSLPPAAPPAAEAPSAPAPVPERRAASASPERAARLDIDRSIDTARTHYFSLADAIRRRGLEPLDIPEWQEAARDFEALMRMADEYRNEDTPVGRLADIEQHFPRIANRFEGRSLPDAERAFEAWRGERDRAERQRSAPDSKKEWRDYMKRLLVQPASQSSRMEALEPDLALEERLKGEAKAFAFAQMRRELPDDRPEAAFKQKPALLPPPAPATPAEALEEEIKEMDALATGKLPEDAPEKDEEAAAPQFDAEELEQESKETGEALRRELAAQGLAPEDAGEAFRTFETARGQLGMALIRYRNASTPLGRENALSWINRAYREMSAHRDAVREAARVAAAARGAAPPETPAPKKGGEGSPFAPLEVKPSADLPEPAESETGSSDTLATKEDKAAARAQAAGVGVEREALIAAEQAVTDKETEHARKSVLARLVSRVNLSDREERTKAQSAMDEAATAYEDKLEARLASRIQTKAYSAEDAEKLARRYRKQFIHPDVIARGEDARAIAIAEAASSREAAFTTRALQSIARRDRELEEKYGWWWRSGRTGLFALLGAAPTFLSGGTAFAAALGARAVRGGIGLGLQATGLGTLLGGTAAAAAGKGYEATVGASARNRLNESKTKGASTAEAMRDKRAAYRKGNERVLKRNRRVVEGTVAILAGSGLQYLATLGLGGAAEHAIAPLESAPGAAVPVPHQEIPMPKNPPFPMGTAMPSPHELSPAQPLSGAKSPEMSSGGALGGHHAPRISAEIKPGFGTETTIRDFVRAARESGATYPPGSDMDQLLKADPAHLNNAIFRVEHAHNFVDAKGATIGSVPEGAMMHVDANGNISLERPPVHAHAPGAAAHYEPTHPRAMAAPTDRTADALNRQELAQLQGGESAAPPSPPAPRAVGAPIDLRPHEAVPPANPGIHPVPPGIHPGEAVQPPPGAENYPAAPFTNGFNVPIDPGAPGIYAGPNGAPMAFGGDMAARTAAAEAYLSATGEPVVYIEAPEPIVSQGVPRPWVWEMRPRPWWRGGPHVVRNPQNIGRIDPNHFTRRLR